MKLFLVALLISQSALAKVAAEKLLKIPGGSIYELAPEKKLLFTFEADVKPTAKGYISFSSRYLDVNKNVVLTEEALFFNRALQKYVIKQSQLDETYELKVSGGKMNFSVIKDGKVKLRTQPVPDNLIIGPSFVPFFQAHWTELQAKKKVIANLAVLDHMDTFSFEFQKMPTEDESNGVTVRMQPTNFIISAFVSPIFFLVQNDGSRILEFRGQMLIKRKVDKGWEDFQGQAVFNY